MIRRLRPIGAAGPGRGTAAGRASLAATLVLGLALATLLLAAAGREAASAAGQGLASAASTQAEAPCRIAARRAVEPARFGLKEPATVTLRLDLSCETRARPLQLVLVIDASGVMRADQLAELKLALGEAVRRLRLAERPELRIGVVSFDGSYRAAVQSHLTEDTTSIVAALNNIEHDPNQCPASPELECGPKLGMRAALDLVGAIRPGPAGPEPEPLRVLMLATGGEYQLACPALRQGAADVRRADVLLVTTCAGDINVCERSCLKDLAQERRFHFRAGRWVFLDRLLLQLADATGPFNPIERLLVEDEPSEKLLYLGSADPDTRFQDGRLSWSFEPHTLDTTDWSVTRTYQVEALDCGRSRASRAITASVRYSDPLWSPGGEQQQALPNPEIEIPCPSATPDHIPPPTTPTPTASPTASASPASPTPTPSPTPSPTTSATPSATGTARPTETRLRRLFLPSLVRYACHVDLSGPAIDLAAVIDVSGSMERPAGGSYGQQMRLEAARDIVARGLLAQSLGPGDQAAILQYGREGELLAELGPCCDRALAALFRLDRLSWSFPWAALERALAELSGPRARPGARRVMVLFTDLAPADLSPGDRARLEARAAEARAAGIALYIVGLGESADAGFMAGLTGRPERVFLVPAMRGVDPALLVGRSLRCSPD